MLMQLPPADRKNAVALVFEYAKSRDVDPKSFGQRLIEAVGRTKEDIATGLIHELDETGLSIKEANLKGESPIGGEMIWGDPVGVDPGVRGWQPVGKFDPENLPASLESLHLVPPGASPELPRQTPDQLQALRGEIARQRDEIRTIRELRSVVKDHLDSDASPYPGFIGALENTGTAIAGASPYIGLSLIPYAGLPLMGFAVRSSEYERLRTTYPSLTQEETSSLASASAVAQGLIAFLSLQTLKGLPATGKYLSALSIPVGTSTATVRSVVLSSLVMGGEALAQGEASAATSALVEGLATSLAQDHPGIDWKKTLAVFKEAQPGTLSMLIPFWLVGTGAISIRHVAGGIRLANDIRGLEGLGLTRPAAERIARAPVDQKDILIREAFQNMTDAEKKAVVEAFDAKNGGAGGDMYSGRTEKKRTKEDEESKPFTKEEIARLSDLFSQPGKVERIGDPVFEALGTDLSDYQVARLAGSHKGSLVIVEGDAVNQRLSLTVVSDLVVEQIRMIGWEDGKLEVYNLSIKVNKQQKSERGYGTLSVLTQVDQAKRLRVESIKCLAARDDEQGTNGFLVWPKLGFDGALEPKFLNALPENLVGCVKVSDLYQSQAGRNWWKQNGSNIWLTFDLRFGAESLSVFDIYLKKKGYEKKGR